MFDYIKEKIIWHWRGQSSSLLTIDINPPVVTLIEIVKRGNDYILESYISDTLSCHLTSFFSDLSSEVVESLASTLKILIKRSGSRCRSGVIALSGPSVVSRQVTLEENTDLADADDIRDQIDLFYDQVIPFPLEDSYYDYVLMGCQPEHNNLLVHSKARGQREVCIAACPRNKVEAWVSLFAAAGVQVEIVTLSSSSIQRALSLILEPLPDSRPKLETEAVITLLDLGKNLSTVYIFQDNRLLLMREFPPYTLELSQELKQQLCEQIKINLEQFMAGQENLTIKSWILSGECSLIEQMRESIEKILAFSVQIADPLAKFHCSDKIPKQDWGKIRAEGSSKMTSLGSMLSAFDNRQGHANIRRINLLPWREKTRQRKNKQFFSFGILVVILAFGFIGMIMGWLYYQTLKVDANIAYLLAAKNNFRESIKEAEALQQDKQTLLKHIEVIDMLQLHRTRWIKFFDALPASIPEGLYLSSLTGKGDTVILEGNARTHCSVAALLKALAEYKGSCSCKDIKLTEIATDSRQDSGLRFKLQFILFANEF